MPQKTAPKLIIFCGLPASGKTTQAKKLAKETSAIRLCPDEWKADLGMDFFDDAFRQKIEDALWKFGKDLLRSGYDVILENGLWARVERDEKRHEAEALGVQTELHFLNVPFDELWRRMQIRNADGKHGTVHITRELLEGYAEHFQAPTQAEMQLFDRAIEYNVEHNYEPVVTKPYQLVKGTLQ